MYWGGLMNKNRKIKNDDYTGKYNSLAETTKANHLDYYDDIITDSLTHRENGLLVNKNIAVMGGFGSGKSSIIKSYFNKHNNYKVLYISLGAYIEQVNSYCDDKEMDFIETSILQQIIYSVEPSKLPFSRIHRIDKNHKFIPICNFILSCFLTLFILFSFCIINYKGTYEIINKPILFVSFCFISSSLVFVINYIVNLFYNSKINKVSINDIDINTEASDISILNRNIDELIHFFKTNDISVVVFEDIDRLKKSQLVFSKLKEINHIINLSIKNKDFIRFIYCIGDNVFRNSEIRTKFFDIIIPIIPFAGTGNYEDILIDKLAKIDIFDEDYLNTIPYYLHNTREINDIINEYKIYYSNIKNINKDDKMQLLYLITYKVLYPDRFCWLINGKGRLFYYFTDDFKKHCKDLCIKSKKEELNSLSSQLVLNKKYFSESNNVLNTYLVAILKENNINSTFDNIFIRDLNNNTDICNLQDYLENLEDYLPKVKEKNISFYSNGVSVSQDQVFTFITKNEFFDKIAINIEENKGISLNKKINKINKEISLYNYNKLSNNDKLNYLKDVVLNNKYLPSNLYSGNVFEDDTLNDFELFLISRNIIQDNYSRFINIKHDNSISENDENIIRSIKSNILLEEGNYQINNISNVVRKLSFYDYYNDSSCFIEIYKYLLINDKINNDLLDQFFNNLTVYKVRFLHKLQNNKDNIFIHLKDYIVDLWNFIDGDNNFLELEIFDLLKYTLISKVIPYNEFGNEKYMLIRVKLTDTDNFIEYLEKHYNEIEEELPKYKDHLIFEYLKIPVDGCNKIKKLIYHNGMFEKRIYALRVLASIGEFSFDYNRVFESAFENDKESLVYYIVFNNIDNTIEDIARDNVLQHDSDTTIVRILNYYTIKDENVNSFLSNEINDIFDLKDLDRKYYDNVLNCNKFNISWANLNLLYLDNKDRFDRIINIIKQSGDILIHEILNFDDYIELFDTILKSNIDDLDNVYNYLLDDREYNYIPDYPSKIIRIIINNFKLKIDNQVDINMIINSNDYNDFDKSNLLICNIYSILDMELNNITNNIISIMLDSNIINQNKIDFAYKYYKNFDNNDINTKLFNILIKDKCLVDDTFLVNVLRGANVYEEKKIEFFNFYYDSNKEYLMCDMLPFLGEKTNAILNHAKNLKFKNNHLYNTFLSHLIDLEKISSFRNGKRGLSISYKKNN